MKNIITIIAALFILSATAWSQDVIHMKDGTIIKGKITEINMEKVKIRLNEDPSAPAFDVKRSDILSIEYEGQQKEVWSNQDKDEKDYVPEYDDRAKYDGPRVGFTYVGDGYIADQMRADGKTPMITQFGYQFETRLFHTPNGLSGRMEFVPMLGGLEQGMFLPSASLMMGIRMGRGLELGMGPNLSRTGMGMIFAIGTSFHSGGVNFPVHLAVLPSVGKKVTTYTIDPSTNNYVSHDMIIHSGVRISLLIGFNVKRH
ncbi:MAG TPA: hypothetical protein VI112_05420 [Bacteroidia bacterium]|jgi:hypothetical protein